MFASRRFGIKFPNKTSIVLQAMGMRSTKYGGIERFNVELARQLKRLYGVSTLFVYETTPESEAYVQDLLESGGMLKVISTRNAISYIIRLSWIIICNRVVLIHGHFTPAKHLALWVGVLWGIKKRFVSLHGRIADRSKMSLMQRMLYYWDFHLASVFAVSQEIEYSVRKHWGDQILLKTMYLGTSPIQGNREESRLRLRLASQDLCFLTIGNNNQVKGYDILCQAIDELQSYFRENHVKIFIVGQEPKDFNEMQLFIKQRGISDIVNLVGITNDVALYIMAADVYLQPSRTEGLPLSMMEACSRGLPMIGSRVGGIPEILHQGVNGLLVNSEDVLSLKIAIQKMIEEPDFRFACTEGSLSVFNSFELKKSVLRYIQEYDI